MLPYWHSTSADLCPMQEVECRTAPARQNCGVGGCKSQRIMEKNSEIVGERQTALDCHTFKSSDTETNWYWLEEDRLQQTPAEQRLLYDRAIDEETTRAAQLEAAELSTFPSLCDYLSVDTAECCQFSPRDIPAALIAPNVYNRKPPPSPEPVVPATALHWRAQLYMGDYRTMSLPSPPALSAPGQPATTSYSVNRSETKQDKLLSTRVTADASVQTQMNNNNVSGKGQGNPGKTVASGRSLSDIEAAVERTRNNSNQQQRYEMRGGHAVEICSRVEFPDKKTRDVSVTVEATHSNGCHRVIMLKGLIAKKRPDLGPKVKDCRLRMDQIVLTRPNTSIEDWQKSITMSYDSDFQVGMGEDKNRAL
ncbi:hypothetical protein BOX15_Mlig002539g1 [Macrostomum lignano]|uniref:Uncharacterized protein n=1 Tax=Macrostomum lignano TaxID=282301 RepID=A0A267F530_9PLAT|nr:hypothetical protein BOX15_Mlig002539g1 [Macrostomum lignano]